MKVYIVTSGTYSDYMIRGVFLNKDKAEEYREWLYDANEIEEYDTSDDIQINKLYHIYIELKWYPDKQEKLSCYIKKDVNTHNFQTYTNYGSWEQISLSRTINENNYDEEYWKNKFIKVAYDLKAHVLYLRSIGLDDNTIKDEIYSCDKVNY